MARNIKGIYQFLIIRNKGCARLLKTVPNYHLLRAVIAYNRFTHTYSRKIYMAVNNIGPFTRLLAESNPQQQLSNN